MEEKIKLYNGVEIPRLIQGLPLIMGLKNKSFKSFEEIVFSSVLNGIYGFDTSHDYGESEKYIGRILKNLQKKQIIKRENIFITTKIGNGQQYDGTIESAVDAALKDLQVDYIDLMLLHWPVPNCYITNWKKLEKVYECGKVKSIGISNCIERHLAALFNSDIKYKPHVVQSEYHPFRTTPELIQVCKENGIAVQGNTSLCQMIPLVTENYVLTKIAEKYHRSIAQIILRWNIQQDIIPIFRSYNVNRIKENANIFDFNIEEDDMQKIFNLNIDYKYHPESMNCPGF